METYRIDHARHHVFVKTSICLSIELNAYIGKDVMRDEGTGMCVCVSERERDGAGCRGKGKRGEGKQGWNESMLFGYTTCQ